MTHSQAGAALRHRHHIRRAEIAGTAPEGANRRRPLPSHAVLNRTGAMPGAPAQPPRRPRATRTQMTNCWQYSKSSLLGAYPVGLVGSPAGRRLPVPAGKPSKIRRASRRPSLEDAVKYGFVSAEAGGRYSRSSRKLPSGARIFTHIPKVGFLGAGIVTATRCHSPKSLATAGLPFYPWHLRGRGGTSAGRCAELFTKACRQAYYWNSCRLLVRLRTTSRRSTGSPAAASR
jgi:hypothetical protein